MHSNEAASIHTAPTLVPPAPTELEQQLRGSLRAQYEAMSTAQLEAESHRLAARHDDNGCLVDGPCDCYRCEGAAELFALHERSQAPVPREPSMLPPAPPSRDPVAIGSLVWHAGPCCETCNGEGYEDTGSNHGGRASLATCRDCGEYRFGEHSSRGQVCGGVWGEACCSVPSPERLSDGGFELPSGALICRSCAAIVVGYRGIDDPIDMGILTALDLAEGGAL